MRKIDAASLELEVDLRDFSRWLTHQGIRHRIIEESGRQVLQADTKGQAELIREALGLWQAGRLQTFNTPPRHLLPDAIPGTTIKRLLNAMVRSPVTTLMSLACLLVAVVSGLGSSTQNVAVLFYPPLPGSSLMALLAAIDGPLLLLRTLTPVFLHFGELHLIFNLLWLWYFGRQLEYVQSSWLFLLVAVITAFSGNTAQYLVSGQSNFGGMSGVVYGLVGYAWILHNFVPRHRLMLSNSMFAAFVAMMVLMEVFAASWIAGAAHAGGLVSGLVLGTALALIGRARSQNSRRSKDITNVK